MRNVEGIVVHCLDVPKGWDEGMTDEQVVAAVRHWHVGERGWRDIGYNAIIRPNGKILNGRDIDKDGDSFEEVGAHAKGKNKISLGVALVGGKGGTANDAFYDHYTVEQDRSLRLWIEDAKRYYPTIKWVRGHNEFAAKACPSFNVARWLAGKPPRTNSTTDLVTGSKDVKVAGGTGLLVAASQYSGDMKKVVGDVEQTLGLDPIMIVVGLALAWWLYSRYTKHKRGVL